MAARAESSMPWVTKRIRLRPDLSITPSAE